MRIFILLPIVLSLAVGCPGPVPVDGGPTPSPSADSGPGPNTPTGEEGGACFLDNTCSGTLVCVDELCVRATEGAEFGPCYPNSTCDGDLACVDDTCVEDVVSVGDEGGACFANGTCNGTLVCTDDICVDGPRPGTEGGACLQNGGCNGSLTCQSDTCQQPLLPTIESFTATPSSITNGESTTIEWTTANTTSCTLTGADDVPVNGSVSVTPQITTTYTLSCQNADEVAEAILTVTVSTPVEILSFFTGGEDELNAITIDRGDTLTLTWSVRFTTQCTLSPGGNVESAGALVVSPLTDVTYTLECAGQGGPVSATVIVTVLQPVTITSFLVNGETGPVTVDIGDEIALTWTSSDADSCALREVGDTVDDLADVSTSGGQTADASENRDFTLTCQGLQGPVSSTVNVFVRPQVAIVDFSSDTSTVTTGQPVTLLYDVVNADACSISNSLNATTVSLDDASGVVTVIPSEPVAYTLTCEGSGGPVSETLTIVTLNPAVIGSFTIDGNPSVVPYLETVTFRWDVADATSGCSIIGPNTLLTAAELGIGTVSAQVFVESDPGAVAEYRLNCVGEGGNDVATINIPVAQVFVGANVRVCDQPGCGPTHTVADLQETTRIAGTLEIATDSGVTLPKLASVSGDITITVIDETVVGLPGLRYAEADLTTVFTNSINDSGPEPSGIIRFDRLLQVDGDIVVSATLAEFGLLEVPELEVVIGSLAIESTTCGLDYAFASLQRVNNLTLNPFSGPATPSFAFPQELEVDGNLSIGPWTYTPAAFQAWVSNLIVGGSSAFPTSSAGSCP